MDYITQQESSSSHNSNISNQVDDAAAVAVKSEDATPAIITTPAPAPTTTTTTVSKDTSTDTTAITKNNDTTNSSANANNRRKGSEALLSTNDNVPKVITQDQAHDHHQQQQQQNYNDGIVPSNADPNVTSNSDVLGAEQEPSPPVTARAATPTPTPTAATPTATTSATISRQKKENGIRDEGDHDTNVVTGTHSVQVPIENTQEQQQQQEQEQQQQARLRDIEAVEVETNEHDTSTVTGAAAVGEALEVPAGTATTTTNPIAILTSDNAAFIQQQKAYPTSTGPTYTHPSSVRQNNTNPLSGGSTTTTTTTIYGQPIHVAQQQNDDINDDSNSATFPNVTSILGPYFCLGQLGKGTFSSIHKCIDMSYYYKKNKNKQRHPHVVAAKVELGTFQQSGVLELEASMIDYLYRHVQPPDTVPIYVGHYRSTTPKTNSNNSNNNITDPPQQFAAIFMEYLPGEDMYQIRERVMTMNNTTATNDATIVEPLPPTRRISVDDAVYLVADVMLPLLRNIHKVGVVHRDVKPSNCVRKGTTINDKRFCMVDFGLSKSIIVGEDSDFADRNHPWIDDYPWMKPLHYTGTKGYYRKERTKADFRGTSMYASLRVHQGRDYCPRDDMWSLIYVFCDLISGGLPWMSMAANRDRTACQKMKEWVHGEDSSGSNNNSDGGTGEATQDHIDELLKGDLYHIAKYRRDRQKESKVDNDQLSPIPEPLRMSSEYDRVFILRDIFNHLRTLQFWDMPNYDVIQSSLRYFRDNGSRRDPPIPMIDWALKPSPTSTSIDRRRRHWWNRSGNSSSSSLNVPEWILLDDDNDLLDDTIFDDVALAEKGNQTNFRSRLPIELRYHLAQMDYNRSNANIVPIHRALHDWMRVVLPLLHYEWNARENEDGGHRTATDGFKRPQYLGLLQYCVHYANAFDNFQSRDCFYEQDTDDSSGDAPPASAVDNDTPSRPTKRRKVVIYHGNTTLKNYDLVFLSKTLFGLEQAIRLEKMKKAPPPVPIQFG